MKELIEKLERLKDLIEVENEVDVDSSIKVINEAIQALTSVKSEQTNVIVRDNISEEPSVKFEINANPENGIVFYADSVKGNGLWIESPSVKSESAEDKKQQWISVEEMLPEFNKYYLVVFETNIKSIVQCVALFENTKRCADVNSKDYDATWYVYPSSGHKISPTHWMPLPELPTNI